MVAVVDGRGVAHDGNCGRATGGVTHRHGSLRCALLPLNNSASNPSWSVRRPGPSYSNFRSRVGSLGLLLGGKALVEDGEGLGSRKLDLGST